MSDDLNSYTDDQTKVLNMIASAKDSDSVLAAKLMLAHYNRAGAHVFADRKSDSLKRGSSIVFIRPYMKPDVFINRYCKDFHVTLFQYKSSEYFKYADKLKELGVACHFADDEESLSTYMWEHLHQNTDYPAVVSYVHDYMKWELNIQESTLFNYGIQVLPTPFTRESTDTYLKLIDGDVATMDRILKDGESIYNRIQELYTLLAKEQVFETTLDGIPVVAINAPRVESTVFAQYLNVGSSELGVTYHSAFPYRKTMYRVYALSDQANAGAVCSAHKGGGMKGVGGFRESSYVLDTLPSRPITAELDYEVLVGQGSSRGLSDAVIKYETIHYPPQHFNVLSASYLGHNVLIYNTPFITNIGMWEYVRPFKEKVGVTYCERADGTVRMVSINFDDTDPGDEFGELLGNSNYRIKIISSLVELGLK